MEKTKPEKYLQTSECGKVVSARGKGLDAKLLVQIEESINRRFCHAKKEANLPKDS